MKRIAHYKLGCQGPISGEGGVGRSSYRRGASSQTGLTPKRRHYNLNNAAMNTFVEVTFVLCPWSMLFKGELVGLGVGTVHDLSLDNVNWATLTTREEIGVLGNTGLATLKRLFVISVICLLSHCLFHPQKALE